MEKLINDINAKIEEFQAEAEKTSNKAAARRARKCSLELEKLFKQYRKDSVAE
jgi:5'-deoxynucleotidase YfbR-like HD superfamily hydrolase